MSCLGKIGEGASYYGACGQKLDGGKAKANPDVDCMACIAHDCL